MNVLLPQSRLRRQLLRNVHTVSQITHREIPADSRVFVVTAITIPDPLYIEGVGKEGTEENMWTL